MRLIVVLSEAFVDSHSPGSEDPWSYALIMTLSAGRLMVRMFVRIASFTTLPHYFV